MKQEQPSQHGGIQEKAAWLAFISQSLAASVEVFLHTRFGKRYLGVQALAVVVAIPLFSLFWPGQNLDGLSYFFWAYLAALILAKIDIARRERKGDVEHSFYSGRPLIRAPFRKADEATAKRVWEPTLVVVVGAVLLPIDQPLGAYLIVAGVGLGISEAFKYGVQNARSMDMNDAMIEQRQLMARFQNSRRN